MKPQAFYKAFFVVLGIFALFYPVIYANLGIVLPNHPAYIQLPAVFLMSAAGGDFLIAQNLIKNTDLVVVRILMKFSFAAVILGSYYTIGIPTVYLPIALASLFSIVICFVFLKWAQTQKAA